MTVSNKKEKSIARDEFFSREMLSMINGSTITKINFSYKKKNLLRKQIKFLRQLGLLANSHKNFVINLN